MTLYAMLAAAVALQIGLAVVAVRQRHVPAWLAIVGPLLAVVAARHGFADFHPAMPVGEIVTELERAAAVGPVLVGMGVVSWIAGVAARRWGRGAPALAQMGAMSIAVGLVWQPALRASALLWTAHDGGDVAAAWQLAADTVRPWGWASVAAFALLWTPVSLWGYWRDRWRGLGEGVAGAVFVALTLSTGRPAGDAVRSVYAPVRAACATVSSLGVQAPPGDVTPMHEVMARAGAVDALERWTDGEWTPWAPDAPTRILWLSDPQASALAQLPRGSEVLFAGRAAAPLDGPDLFRNHPVVASAHCRAHRDPYTAGDDASTADAARGPAPVEAAVR